MNICGQAGAMPVPSRLPNVPENLLGGFRRSGPTGGSANGMALKASTPSSDLPVIVPPEGS